MLKQYGPDVPQNVLSMLVDAFSELREMADLGQIAYPYSTREVVNVVKHLQVRAVTFQPNPTPFLKRYTTQDISIHITSWLIVYQFLHV